MIADARGDDASAPPTRTGSLTELQAEVQGLRKASSRLLAQRRKLQARLGGLVEEILEREPDLEREFGADIRAEMDAAAANADHLEAWVGELARISATLMDEHRSLSSWARRARQDLGELAAERDRILSAAAALENERLVLVGRLEAEADSHAVVREALAENTERLVALEAELSSVRTAMDNAPPSTPEEWLTEARTRLAEAEAKARSLGLERENDRREHAREVAGLTRQLSEQRERYEGRVTVLTEKCRRLAEMLVETERRVGAEPGEAPAPPVRRMSARPEPAARPAPVSPRREAARPTPAAPDGEILVVDDDPMGRETAANLSETGIPAKICSVEAELGRELRRDDLVCTALNLARAHAWTAVRLSRGGTRPSATPLIGYAASEPLTKGFWFGPIEVVVLPVAPGTLGKLLRRVAPRLQQALIISRDEGVGLSVAKHLRVERVSAAVVADRHQALEAIKTSYPHVAIVYPRRDPGEVFTAVAAVRGVSLFRKLPVVFVLDRDAHGGEEEGLAGAVRGIVGMGSLTREDLSVSLSWAFKNYGRKS